TIVTNTDILAKRRDVLVRFMQAYRETIDYMYDGDKCIKDYAEFVNIPEAMAKRVRDEFFPKSILQTDEIKGLDSMMPEAVELKFIRAALTPQEISKLVQVPFK